MILLSLPLGVNRPMKIKPVLLLRRVFPLHINLSSPDAQVETLSTLIEHTSSKGLLNSFKRQRIQN